MNNVKGLSVDLKVYEANNRNTLNILSNRAGFVEENAYVDKTEFSLDANSALDVPDIGETKVFILYSTKPVNVVAQINDNVSVTEFDNQIVMTICGNVTGINIENTNSVIAAVQIIRFSKAVIVSGSILPRQLITFSALSRVAQLPQAIQNLSKVKVQNLTLLPWTNDQTTPYGNSGNSVLNKFRICDSDGTANIHGSYIMILNDVVSQQNFSGSLQLWVEETI